MVKEKFPGVTLIRNEQNTGFSVANNQAIRVSSGEYILLLNPDTVLREDTLSACIRFMDQHSDAGGLGVKMIDGKGRFLPESKRGLPTPWVAFYKIFGLSALFPRSRRFGRYHLSYLPENETHTVDVLSGAFMFLRREVLNKTGLLDENFFMYGEDIDLSYRITCQGYKNYYFPETTIIHYKGESTRKNSINYIRVFYQAMIIFAAKHYTSGNARILSFFIRIAIWFRALLAVAIRFLHRILLPFTDAALIFAGIALILPFWEKARYEPGYYPDFYLRWVVPVYILFWLAGILFSGGYKVPLSLFRTIRGVFWGTIALLLTYSLIPEELRFSRGMVLLGSLWAFLILPLARVLISQTAGQAFRLENKKSKKIAIAGHLPSVLKVKDLLNFSHVKPVIAGYIAASPADSSENFLGELSGIREIIRVNHIDEVIFCSDDISSSDIITAMLELADTSTEVRIAPPESMSIIGSRNIHTAGDFYQIDINAVNSKMNKRVKRTVDLVVSMLLLVFVWIEIFLVKNRRQLFRNIWSVLTGSISWVGYIPFPEKRSELPFLKTGVLHPGMLFPGSTLSHQRVRQLNLIYAKDYRFWNDLELVFINLPKLDRHAGT
jgi:GT2 family glycosyltransferase